MDDGTQAAAAAIKSNVDDFFAGVIDRATFDAKQEELWANVRAQGSDFALKVSHRVCPYNATVAGWAR